MPVVLPMQSKRKDDDILSEIYYNPTHSVGFGSIKKLSQASQLNKTKVGEWLQYQPTYTLHKPARWKFKRRRYVTRGLNMQYQADLADLPNFVKNNDGYRYILTMIDVFSRFAFARALKTKSGVEVANALSDIFQHRRCKILQTDNGKEFYNQHVQEVLKKYDIELFSVNNEIKCALVERFNRTLKDKMFKYFTYNGGRRWIDILQTLINTYNNTTHSSIKRTPASITDELQGTVWLEQYGRLKTGKTPKFKLNDRVRISNAKRLFSRGYTPNWSFEEFFIHDINTKYDPIMYTLRDSNDEIVQGRFYSYELQSIKNPDSVYIIEKVLKTRYRGIRKQALVKWRGYKQSEWIPYKNIASLSTI